jgi:Flp pilus assembly protein TadD
LAQALRLDPNYAPAHLHLGIIYLQNNRINDAIREFNYVIQIAPNTPIAYQAQRIVVNYLP